MTNRTFVKEIVTQDDNNETKQGLFRDFIYLSHQMASFVIFYTFDISNDYIFGLIKGAWYEPY